jgi:hypothetical protein
MNVAANNRVMLGARSGEGDGIGEITMKKKLAPANGRHYTLSFPKGPS